VSGTDLETLLFVGTTYVYCGEYPRTVSENRKSRIANSEKPSSALNPQSSLETVDRDRMSPEERQERGRRDQRRNFRLPRTAGKTSFGRRGQLPTW